jgi:hypothetical protein
MISFPLYIRVSKHEELQRLRANSIHPPKEAVNDYKTLAVLVSQASQAAQKVSYFVIPSEARNLSSI